MEKVIEGCVNEWQTTAQWQDYRCYVVAVNDFAQVFELRVPMEDGLSVCDPSTVRLQKYQKITNYYGDIDEWLIMIDLVRVKDGWQVKSFQEKYQNRDYEVEHTWVYGTDEIDMIEPIRLPVHYSRYSTIDNRIIDRKQDDFERGAGLQ